jgi:ABC-type iron transport system FetAB permease component
MELRIIGRVKLAPEKIIVLLDLCLENRRNIRALAGERKARMVVEGRYI